MEILGPEGFLKITWPSVSQLWLHMRVTSQSLKQEERKKRKKADAQAPLPKESDSSLPANAWTPVLFKSFQVFLMGNQSW